MTRRLFLTGTAAAAALAAGCSSPADAARDALTGAGSSADAALDRALVRLVGQPDGPPGAIAVVQRGSQKRVHRAGTAQAGAQVRPAAGDSMRLASVAKAFSGATALSVAADGTLSLTDPVGQWLPGLPGAWSKVQLRQLLNHTSGIPDFSQGAEFRKAVVKSPLKAPAPRDLLSYASAALNFPPGSKYEYSNSDNIVVGLMVEAATGKSYESQLQQRVFGPLGLAHTSLPRGNAVPAPLIHGYDVDPPKSPEDITGVIAAGWSWASGGIVSTPDDASTFIRGYARGATTSSALHAAQFSFRSGGSEPPGPGQNSAGLAVFRYQTGSGPMYGHTGNTLGYTQFLAATADGARSAVVSVNAQLTLKMHPRRFADLRQIYALAVTAALAGS